MAGVITLLDQPRTLNAQGKPTSAVIFFYNTGTTVLADIYNDEALTDPAENPILLASGEIFPDIYLDPAITYRRRIVYGDGSIHDVDPLPGGADGSDSIIYDPDYPGGVDQTLTEKLGTIVSVTDFIDPDEWPAIKAGTSTFNATSAIHAARNVVKGTGGVVEFPFGTYYVSELTFDGNDYQLRTNGCSFQQTPGLTTNGDGMLHPIITIPEGSYNIRLGDFNVRGNIATDFNEFSHGVAIMSADNITIGNVYGEDIRGDVIYQYGRSSSELELSNGVVMGIISGSNIFRCIVAHAGGQAQIEGIIQKGPVGFQDFDAEPNTGGVYQQVQSQVGFIIGSAISSISADPAILNKSVQIGWADLDYTRRVNTTPPYSSHGDSALTVSCTDQVHIGSLRLRNYPQYPVNLGEKWKSVSIDNLDAAACETTGSAYKAIFVQQNLADHGTLRLRGVNVTLHANNRVLAFNNHSVPLKVDIADGVINNGQLGFALTGTVANIDCDLNGGAGEIFLNSCNDMVLTNLKVTDSATGYGLYNCARVVFINSSANFGAGFEYLALSTNVTAVNSALNGSSTAGVNVLLGGAYRVNGTKVVGAQGAAVTAPTGGATIDSEGRTAINALIARLQAHGLIL